jgi:hypothetical protein
MKRLVHSKTALKDIAEIFESSRFKSISPTDQNGGRVVG